VCKGGVSPLAENLGFARIDRNDPIPSTLHISRYGKTGAPCAGGETDDRNGAIGFEDFFDAHNSVIEETRPWLRRCERIGKAVSSICKMVSGLRSVFRWPMEH